ncbi:PmbA protein [Methanofollis sp. W23]|uniref:TldD/PmbA family protein n=1 Tax=Methanofollis sp. W23 TaxID=2817849 RepID=UPI001DFBE749|nr:TldD/PmbA family protein [Methanofollis sp. W23]MBP2146353.1 PmbA protein [Methanofollis sp. W23]
MALIEEILKYGRTRAEEVEVYVAEGESVSTDLKKKQVENAGGSEAFGIGIRVIDHGRIGVSATSSRDEWRRCVDAALASANLAHPQEWKGLPAPAALPDAPAIFDPSLSLDPAWCRKILEEMLDGVEEHDAAVTGGGASVSRGKVVIANTAGVRYEQARTSAGCSLECIHGQSTGYEFDASCFAGEIDPVRVGREAAFFAEQSGGGEEIETGDYDLVLSPVAFAQLLGYVLEPALSGRNVHAGRSWLAGKLGEVCIGEEISVHDNPLDRGLSSTQFDAEGMPARKLTFFDHGELQQYAYDLRTAYRYGAESTGSAVRGGAGGAPAIGVHTLVVDGPRDSVDDERAVYVHDVVGAHTANPLTGDFSVELSNPFIVEGGEYVAPVKGAMYAGNVFALLGEVAALGREERSVGGAVLPAVRLSGQHLIGR